MSDQLQSSIDSKSLSLKLKATIDKINTRLASSNNTSISNALSEMNKAFKNFFDTLADPQFKPIYFLDGDTPRSEEYNNNLISISDDLSRFYSEINTLEQAQIKAYNFSNVLVSEITTRANGIASMVLDLNILNGFTRTDSIVAGDDFKTNDYIDTSEVIASTKADVMTNGNGIGLSRVGATNVLSNSRIEVTPIEPVNGNSVNTKPTPGNVERFYEGLYYGYIGSARPEGGSNFNIKYIVDTSNLSSETVPDGFYVELGAPEQDKKLIRNRMIDGDPGSFWECEYVIKTPTPLISDTPDNIVQDEENQSTVNANSGTIKISLEEAEKIAQQYDTLQRDLVIDLVITLNSLTSINYLAINPVIFGSSSFPEIEDIATASSNDGEFITVDGWDRIRFPKTITPEANEFLTDSQLGATLSPGRNNYLGQGVYPFPVRQAKKIKLRIRSRNPVPAIYERTYALLKKQVDIDTTTTTTTKKGALRF